VVINAVTHGVPDDVVIEEPDRLGLPSFGTTSKWVFQKSDASRTGGNPLWPLRPIFRPGGGSMLVRMSGEHVIRPRFEIAATAHTA
jgi:hypothetical protein